MKKINYDGRVFRAVENSASGEVGGGTVFRYRQAGRVVWADYDGGGVVHGHLLAVCDDEGNLDMRYHHVNAAGEIKTGICRSTPEILPNGRLRLHESWRWTCGDNESGESILDEIVSWNTESDPQDVAKYSS